jgi:hypothetical protein
MNAKQVVIVPRDTTQMTLIANITMRYINEIEIKYTEFEQTELEMQILCNMPDADAEAPNWQIQSLAEEGNAQ